MVKTTDMGNGMYRHEIEPHDVAQAMMYYIHEAQAGFVAIGRSLGSLPHVFDGFLRQNPDWESNQEERQARLREGIMRQCAGMRRRQQRR